ncbi:uncharacterized protein LOC141652515 [Silene latifolia]|uniref:uncharacterized protein LOC141652515 n=1 Tax=Silene latifolia TaxID=37657 RepID=UPI003D77DAC8
MRWHYESPRVSGTMSHPSDSEAWKHFDRLYPSFASESRNVRLGLCTDGFSEQIDTKAKDLDVGTKKLEHSTLPELFQDHEGTTSGKYRERFLEDNEYERADLYWRNLYIKENDVIHVKKRFIAWSGLYIPKDSLLISLEIFTARYKAILHIHSVAENCEIVDLLEEIDPETKKPMKNKPPSVKSGAVVLCRIQEFGVSDAGTEEPVSVLRPYNLSEVMESILEEESDEDWVEVPGRSNGQITDSPSSSRVSGLQLTNSDVKDELEYGSTAVYCYVLGANPPWKVLDGFVKRIWGYTEIEKIAFHSNGIFMVRFKTEAMKVRVLQAGPVFFDNMPIVVKEWTPESKLIREAVDMVPIWIRFYGLPLKFWGNALKKIASLVGNPIRCDSNSQLKSFLGYARIMVEVKVGDELPDVVEFMDELDVKHRQIVHYEWKPTICTECKALGHFSHDCRRKDKQPKGPMRGRKTWVPKKIVPSKPQLAASVQAATLPSVTAAAGPAVVTLPEQSRVMMPRSGEGSNDGRMGSIGFWNVQGFNSSNKQTDVRRFLHLNNVGLFGILETRVRINSINKVHNGLGSNWSLVTNISSHDGGRIWLIWDAMNYKVEVLSSEAQVINTKVTFLSTGVHWWVSVVYGFNRIAERVPLWESLTNMSGIVDGPWVVMGDFNNVLAMNERIGSEVTIAEMRGFQNCVDARGLMDIPAHGAFFTWNNKHEVGDKVYSRIDRVLVNDDWLLHFPESHTMFHPEGLFDHCPCTISLWPEVIRKRGSFKYFNMWGSEPTFGDIVKQVWDQQIEGHTMFQVVKKLKLLKQPLKALNASCYANIETAANVALIHLHDIQLKLQLDPSKVLLQQNEKLATEAYRELDKARVSFLSQKAKTQWCSEGDENTSYFHSTLKARRLQNSVFCILNRHGVLQNTNAGIEAAFEDYYRNLLGASKWVGNVHVPTVRHRVTVSEAQAAELIRDVTDNEIYEALVSIPPNKSLGPDGYTSQFYKDAYTTVGKDVIQAVKEFFITGKLLKQVNSTTLTLIPKKDRPLSVSASGLLPVATGDRISIKVLLRAFATFSFISGLEMNCDKSEIYFNGMNQGEVDYVLSISGFKEGSFPFRYLGIPISYKRMAIGDCTRLVEKVVSKLRSWGAKKLSYSGRLVLIQAVLSQLHVYWTRIFVIPATVLDRITAICRNYLWSGSEQYGRTFSVAWDSLCTEKKFGGLGLVNCRLWNQALIGKYTWWLACKSDHLWIK